MKISKNNTINNELNFKNVSEEFVTKQINKLNVKKATGHDGISPNFLFRERYFFLYKGDT
jgi:hypothetical protein